MGPLGFALGLDGALDKCAADETSVEWATWYLDDGTIIGFPEAVGNYLASLIPALKDVGLDVNINKCQLWGPGTRSELQATLMGLAGNHPLHHIPAVPFEPTVGITVLGVPVDVPGSLVAGVKKWDTATQATLELLKKLRKLPDGQLRHCLLRHCLDACRVTHLMCSKCHAAGAQAVPMLADALREAVGDVVGCGLTHGAWEQATIPISKGGLWVRDPERCWAEARAAAIVAFHAQTSKLVGLPATIASFPVPDTPQVLTRLSSTLGPQHDPISQWVLNTSSLATAPTPRRTGGAHP